MESRQGHLEGQRQQRRQVFERSLCMAAVPCASGRRDARPMATSGTGGAYTAFINDWHADVDRRWASGCKARSNATACRRACARRVRCRSASAACSATRRNSPPRHLSAEIANAQRSGFLVVVCSPRTPGSRWVAEEIERFRALGRGRQVLALLVEGEPAQSFPDLRPSGPALATPAQEAAHPPSNHWLPTCGRWRTRRSAKESDSRCCACWRRYWA